MIEAKLTQQQVVQSYTGKAAMYDLWAALTESKARQAALTLANIQNGEHILEVAVGTGLMFKELVTRNPQGTNSGVDLTPAMLDKAIKKVRDFPQTTIHLDIGSAFELAQPDSSVDLLVNNYMFDLMPEKDFIPLLIEFKRVLKPGGRLLLVNMAEAQHWYQGFWQWVYTLNPNWMGGCRGVTLAPYLIEAGFHNIQEQRVTQLGFPSEILVGVKNA